jgi:hypothetical protein
MKGKLYFIVVLSALIAIYLPLTGCRTAVTVDESAPEQAAMQPVAEPAAEPTPKQAVDEPAAEPSAEQAVVEKATEEAVDKPATEKAAEKPAPENAEEPAPKPTVDLEITRAAICRQVVEREPVDAGTSFEPSVERLYCFTHITGAQDATEIYHVWYFAETERAVVKLKVNSASWRTYSSKIIQPHEIGDWRVDVLGPEGNILKSVHFEITQ